MYAIADLARITGFTSNQIRDRLALLSPIFSNDVHRGKRGKILVGDDLLAALRRMAELERDGLSPKVAQSVIVRELGGNDGKGKTMFVEGGQGSTQEALIARVQLLELRLQDKDELIKQLQSEVAFLRARIEELTPLALPHPRRGLFSWLSLRRLIHGSASD